MQETPLEIMPETKNKSFVLVSAILLISIAIVIAIFFNKNRTDQQSTQEDVVQEQEQVVTDFESSQEGEALLFADLIANRQGSYLCQIEDEGGSYIYYFDDERMAIEVKVEGSHMKTIVDRDFTYNWDVDEKVGTKFSNQEDFIEDDLDQESEVFDEDLMEDMDEENMLPEEDIGPFDPANFVCRAWELDESFFTPPTDVIFQDLSQLQEQMMDFAE